MVNIPQTKKSLGQHWLHDVASLTAITNAADLSASDTVLEIGPGTGTLTRVLLKHAGQVIAVEKDEELVRRLIDNFKGQPLQIIPADILTYDLKDLPSGYKLVANIPYYLTSHLLRSLSTTTNSPVLAVLLVQKEVAARVCARAGAMSLLSVSVQYYWQAKQGSVVAAKLFTPPPKVDSQILILQRRRQPLFLGVDDKLFFQLVKAGFSERRKKLKSSLSGGLRLDKSITTAILAAAHIDPDLRAQALTLEQWHQLYVQYLAFCQSPALHTK